MVKLKVNQQGDVEIFARLEDEMLDGGIYMFLLDGVPLYVGETNVFLKRLTEHLYELKKNPSYFGLGALKGKHKIDFLILQAGLPYVPDLVRKEKEHLKKTPDQNRQVREERQNALIEKYRPLTQKPAFDTEQYGTLKRKKDAMIQNWKIKDKIVKEGLEKHREQYKSLASKEESCGREERGKRIC